MIQEELRNFIEQNCSGKEPSDLIMEAIGKKIEQLGADADEVLAFVEECVKGPTLEQKAEAARRAAEAEIERQAQVISSIRVLADKVEKIYSSKSWNKKQQLSSVISMFPVPNAKEDILEFLTLSAPYAKTKGGFWGSRINRWIIVTLFIIVLGCIFAQIKDFFGYGVPFIGNFIIVSVYLCPLYLIILFTPRNQLTWNDKAQIWRAKFDQVMLKGRSLNADSEFQLKLDGYEKMLETKSHDKAIIGAAIVVMILSIILGIVCYPKSEEVVKLEIKEQVSDLTKQISSLVKEGHLDEANSILVDFDVYKIGAQLEFYNSYDVVRNYDLPYYRVIKAYVDEGKLDEAEELAIAWKTKIADDGAWDESSCYSLLKSAFESQGRDFSILKSCYDEELEEEEVITAEAKAAIDIQYDDLIEQIDALDVPDELNYKTVQNALLKIRWKDIDESKYHQKKKDEFLDEKRSVAERIYQVYKDLNMVDKAPDEIRWPSLSIKK